jgi:hypothetical protein
VRRATERPRPPEGQPPTPDVVLYYTTPPPESGAPEGVRIPYVATIDGHPFAGILSMTRVIVPGRPAELVIRALWPMEEREVDPSTGDVIG